MYSEKEKIKIKVANQMYFKIYFQMSTANSPEKSKHRSLYLTVSTPSCALFLWKTLLKEKLRKLQASQCRSIRPYFDINGSKKKKTFFKSSFSLLYCMRDLFLLKMPACHQGIGGNFLSVAISRVSKGIIFSKYTHYT